MKPILYEAGTTDFTNNGIGRLSSCISCLVTEERNGIFECEFQYPITGKHYEEIQEGRIITVSHDERGDRQPFIIYRRSAVLGGVVTFNAHHVSYLLNNIILNPFEATSPAGAFAAIPNHSMGPNPFDFWTDNVTAGGTIAVTVPTAVRAFLGGSEGSFLDRYGGEYEWDGYTVKNHAHRGSNNGVTIRYGKNLTKLEQEVDALDLYDSVVPYWVSEETVVFGGVVTGTGQTAKLMRALDLSSYYEEAPTVAQLETRAQTFLDSNQPWIPKENINIDFVALWQTEEYKDIAPLERVQLCDTVTVVYTDLGVQATAKVIEVVWDAILERYNKIEIGDTRSSFANTILTSTEQQIASAVADLPTEGMMNNAIDHATDLITGGLGGYIVINWDANGYPNELLIMDSPNKETAVNVWRWNSGGLGHSHSGYNGPYNDVAITQDGKINASMITAGTMNANLIRAGILADTQGYNFWNLATGEFKLSWNSTIGNQTIQEVIDGAGGYSLETPFTWSNGGQTANFEAVVYKGTEDVTDTFDPNWFVWTLRTEDGETQVGTGTTLSLNRSQFGYGATVTCTFTTYDDVVALRSVDNKKLKSVDGKQLRMYANQDEDVLVSDLPIKTAAEVDPTDKLMGIDNVEGYQVSITNFGDFLATSKYDGRYYTQTAVDARFYTKADADDLFYTKADADARFVNIDGDTMVGNLVLEKSTANEETKIVVRSTDTVNGVWLGVGTGGVNHGVYSESLSKWLIYGNANGMVLSQTVESVTIQNTNITVGSPPSSNTYGKGFYIRDSAGAAMGCVRAGYLSDDRMLLQIVAYRSINGVEKYNNLNFYIDDEGNATVMLGGTGIAASWRSAIGAVSKSGDTMTGNLSITKSSATLTLKSTNVTVGTAPSSTVYSPLIQLLDSAGNAICYWRGIFATDGRTGYQLEAYRSVNGSNVYNNISLFIASNGTRTVSVSDANAWRNALGVNNARGGSASETKSLTSGTVTSLTSVTFSAGTYVITAVANFASNNSGRRRIHFSTTSGGNVVDRYCTCGVSACNGSNTEIGFTVIKTFSASTTYYLCALQNSGGALNAYGGIEYVKLH